MIRINALILTLYFSCFSVTAHAEFEIDWASATLDNDLFLNNDNGYTNGIFFAVYDTGRLSEQPEPSSLVWPLLWSLPETDYLAGVTAYTLGQIMMTPDDITLRNPPEDELPYSGVLFLNATYLAVQESYADKLSTTLGIVGPASGAKRAQKLVHNIIGANDPKGWGTQLENEPVVQLGRGRAWRAWASADQRADIITHAEVAVGNLSSFVETGLTMRYGRGLKQSYASILLNSGRTANPVAIDNGWYVYAGLTAGYVFNQIFTDGNTFRDSRSIDYDHERIGATAGIAYSWGPVSITLALSDANILDTRSEEQLEDLTQYGSLTFAWRFDK